MRDEGKQEKDEQPTSQKQSNVKESAVSLETKWGTPIKETQNPKGLVPQHRTQLYQRGDRGRVPGAEKAEPERQHNSERPNRRRRRQEVKEAQLDNPNDP